MHYTVTNFTKNHTKFAIMLLIDRLCAKMTIGYRVIVLDNKRKKF